MRDVHANDVPALVRQVLGDSLGYLYPAALRVAVRLGVADVLAEGPASPPELAERVGAEAGRLRRVLRFLATRGVFHEDEAGTFHLTPAARLLHTGSPVPLASIVALFTDEMYWLPAGRLEDTVRNGGTVFADVFGAPFFDHVLRDAQRQRLFDTALADLSVLEQGPVADAYDFPVTGTVVDVAGGRGGLLHAVLTRNPGLRGVLFDREPVLGHHRLGDPAIAGRWETAAGDFYASVPGGADVYLLKRILHDKSDEECRAVLRTIRRAMTGGARLLVIDPVVPADGTANPHVLSDVLMMTVWGGRERTEAELRALLAGAQLNLTRVIPTGAALSIAEAVPA